MGKAFYEITTAQGGRLQVMSMYDGAGDAAGNNYFPATIFKGFAQAKFACFLQALRQGVKKDTVILSHVNLLPIGWLIKKISPSTQLVLLTHGIEIWKPLTALKKKWLQACDRLLAVSEFTRQKLVAVQGVEATKIIVLNNCLDPLLPAPAKDTQGEALRQRYGIPPDAVVLFTLTRLAATERHKGYDKVIRCITDVQQATGKNIFYVIAGKYSPEEAAYIRQTATTVDAEDKLILTGFLPDEEIAAHFNMADIYIMPSTKEGFGIVFIEAMYYGLPVIAGNRDGSVDALAHGRLGLLVNPGDDKAIQNAIAQILAAPEEYQPDQQLLNDLFSYDRYKEKLKALLC